jgi:hypothetical protein
MNGHAARKASAREERVALDVASSTRWFEAADGASGCAVTLHEVAELPWPLVVTFVAEAQPDGSTRWDCRRIEIGREDLKVTATSEQMRHIGDNFDRYRLLAEYRIALTDENRERSRRLRGVMTKKRAKGEKWTYADRELLVNEYRALEGDPRGRMKVLAQRWNGVYRQTINRQLWQAEADGQLGADELPHRSR